MIRSLCVVALLGPALASISLPRAYAAGKSNSAKQPDVVKAYGQLPLSFTANEGQDDPAIAFQTRGSGYSISLERNEAVLSLKRSGHRRSHKLPLTLDDARGDEHAQSVAVAMHFPGAADNPPISGVDELPGKANYLIGNDASKWHTEIPTYGKVKYAGLYPGIDLLYYGNQKQLEFDFIVQPGADANAIKLAFRGEQAAKQIRMRISRVGDLLIGENGKEVVLPRPVVYQLMGDATLPSSRHVVDAGYVLAGTREVRFRVGAYDKSKPLVIDPTVAYSTFLGGNGDDYIYGVAVDSAGEAYVAGTTSSVNFPVTPGAIGPGKTDNTPAFISKLNATGTALLYSTYLGGADGNGEQPTGIAVDAAGDAFITGFTSSADFPTTPGAYQRQANGDPETFVSKLNPTGTRLIYSTYLYGQTTADAIAVDSTGNAYVTGYTLSAAFPTTAGAYQTDPGPYTSNPQTAFLTKFNPTGSALVYSTFLGQRDSEGFGVAVDPAGDAYVTGFTNSGNFPTTPGALSTTGYGFVTKFNPSGSGLLYSTCLKGFISPNGIAIDASGSAYVTGAIEDGTIVTTPGAYQTSRRGNNAFVMKLNPAGSAYVYSTYLGGNKTDEGFGIAVDTQGNAYIAGDTRSTNFPTTEGAFQATYAGSVTDAFFAKLNAEGSGLLYSTFLGGSDIDSARAIAVDPSGNAYVGGYTFDGSFPTTNPAFQRVSPGGTVDAFVTKFSFSPSTGTTSQTITFGFLANHVYGAGPISLTATATSGLPVSYTATGPVTLAGNELSIQGAGEVTVTASQAGNSEYSVATPVTRSFTVNKATLQATADNTIRPVGVANPSFTYTLTGFVHGETTAVVGGSATVSTTATAASGPGTYPIVFAGESLTAANYTFDYVSGTLTITAQQCQTITSYANGFTAAGLSLNHGAQIQGSLLQLTDGRVSESRTAFYTAPVLITAFTTDFNFQLLDAVADGITFTVQSNSAKSYGIGGQGLGFMGIPNSAAVKFDLHNNQGEGFDSMGFYQEGVDPTVPDVDLSPTGIDLHSGHVFHVHIAYANANTAVTISDTQTGASASHAFPGDLSTTVGPGAYVGFTAGTGAKTAIQTILNWSFAGGPGCSNSMLAR